MLKRLPLRTSNLLPKLLETMTSFMTMNQNYAEQRNGQDTSDSKIDKYVKQQSEKQATELRRMRFQLLREKQFLEDKLKKLEIEIALRRGSKSDKKRHAKRVERSRQKAKHLSKSKPKKLITDSSDNMVQDLGNKNDNGQYFMKIMRIIKRKAMPPVTQTNNTNKQK